MKTSNQQLGSLMFKVKLVQKPSKTCSMFCVLSLGFIPRLLQRCTCFFDLFWGLQQGTNQSARSPMTGEWTWTIDWQTDLPWPANELEKSIGRPTCHGTCFCRADPAFQNIQAAVLVVPGGPQSYTFHQTWSNRNTLGFHGKEFQRQILGDRSHDNDFLSLLSRLDFFILMKNHVQANSKCFLKEFLCSLWRQYHFVARFFRFSLFQDARVRTFYESVFVHMYMPEQQANWIHGKGGRRRRSDKWSPKWAQRWPPPCKPYITSLVFIPAKPSQQTVWGRTRGIPAIGFSYTEMDYRLVQFLKLARPVMDLRGNLWRPTSRTKKQTSFPLPTMKKCSKSWWSR